MKQSHIITFLCIALLCTAFGPVSLSGCIEPPQFSDYPENHQHRESQLRDVQIKRDQLDDADIDTIVSLSSDRDFRVRRKSAQKLADLAAKNDRAAEALSRLATDEHYRVRTAAITALRHTNDPDHHRRLIASLCDPHHLVNTYAHKTVRKMGTGISTAILDALRPKGTSATIPCKKRTDSAHTLQKEVQSILESMDTRAIPLLTAGLSHDDPSVAITAATMLGRLGHTAVAALPNLCEAIDRPSHQLTLSVIDAITRIGDLHPFVMPALHQALSHESPRVTQKATQSIHSLQKVVRQKRPSSRRSK